MTIAFCAVRRESPRADPGERQAEPAGVPQVPLRRQPVGLRLRRPQDCPGTKAITPVHPQPSFRVTFISMNADDTT